MRRLRKLESFIISYNCNQSNGIFELYNLQGKLVRTQLLPSEAKGVQLDLAKLPRGLYIYKIKFQSCASTSGKLQLN
jgi:hypothetical protein